MKVSKYLFNQIMEVHTIPWNDLPYLSRRVGKRATILKILPIKPEGLGVTIWSNVSKVRISRHLLAKWSECGYLRKSERLIGAMLFLGIESVESEFLNFIISYEIRDYNLRLALWKELLPYISGNTKSAHEYYRAFDPEIFFAKEYYHRLKFPAKRYIGVGYSDYGHLSTTLAWQEQIVFPENVRNPSSEMKVILSHYLERALPYSEPS